MAKREREREKASNERKAFVCFATISAVVNECKSV